MKKKENTNPDLDLAWGARDIGQVIGRDERAAYWLLEKGRLPAKKIGRVWVASRAKLIEHLVGGKEAA
jgi:hypothetical protein